LSIDAWQIGSLSPPTVCLCCGSKFDEETHRRHGPYESGPYKYVCNWFWKKSYMWFSDKITWDGQTGDDSLVEDVTSTAPIMNIEVTSGRKIPAKLVTLHIRKLHLNPKNPRIRHKFDGETEADIEEQLWHEEGTKGLYNEIRYSGGLSDKPIVSSELKVIEGNRRITCLRRLDEEAKNGEIEFSENAFERVQCLMLPSDVEPKDVDLLVARVHVSGKREWSPLNQAEQVFEMANQYGMTTREIATALSRSPHAVELMLAAFRSTLDYGERFPDNDGHWIHKFSYFYELFRSTYLREWAKEKRNMNFFMKLLAGERPKLYQGRQVRELPALIKDPEYSRLLSSQGFDKAMEIAKTRQVGLDQFTKKLVEASAVLQRITKDPRKHLKDPEKLRIVGEIRKKTEYILAGQARNPKTKSGNRFASGGR